MTTQKLFQSKDGGWVTNDDLLRACEKLRIPEAEVVYMHTGLTFGSPNRDLARVELLQSIFETLRGFGIATLCVPTFTFSFCGGEDYDVEQTKSQMGALNEFIRKQPDAVRSVDPLMSVAMVGKDRDLVENLGHQSIGEKSTFDKLSRRRNVQFLFLGVRLGDCFTYMHYIEWRMKVPYRYDREFTGTITHGNRTWQDTYTLFVRYKNVVPGRGSYAYEELLKSRGLLRSTPLGDNAVSCIAEPEASEVYRELLTQDPNYFIECPFSTADADRSFQPRRMVAL